MSYHELTIAQVLLASGLILVNGLISVSLKLGLERRLFVASVRTIVQLALIGQILEWIFNRSAWWMIILLAVVMTTAAGMSAVGRVERKLPGIYFNSVLSVFVSSWIITSVTLYAIFGKAAWSDNPAQYVIPFLGLILGNALNGISIGMDKFGDQLVRRRSEIELILSLGGTRWEACRDCVRAAVRTGMIPITNSMMVVGIVSLPGIMTGQLLSGTPPMEAVKYQIVIMFVIAAATALGTIGVVLLSYRRMFNSAHQFLYDSIR